MQYLYNKGKYKNIYNRRTDFEKACLLALVVFLSIVTLLAFLVNETKPLATNIVHAEEVEEFTVVQLEEVEWNETTIKAKVWEKASKYGASPTAMWNTMKCENPMLEPELQSYVINKHGIREDSWGLAQFHIPSGNKTAEGVTITRSMAKDPEVAIDSMAYLFSIGKARLWTCYRNLYL